MISVAPKIETSVINSTKEALSSFKLHNQKQKMFNKLFGVLEHGRASSSRGELFTGNKFTTGLWLGSNKGKKILTAAENSDILELQRKSPQAFDALRDSVKGPHTPSNSGVRTFLESTYSDLKEFFTKCFEIPAK